MNATPRVAALAATPPASAAASLADTARRIAREVAAPNADAVDRDSHFPHEAVAAMREAGLLGAAVPVALGGMGAGIADIAAACYELGQGCGNAAMVFAMHQIQVACILRHGGASPWHQAFLRRLAAEQLLLASATTEAGPGGDVRSSECAVTNDSGRIALEKEGCVISYAAEADAVLITARRHPDAPPSDQVLLVAEKPQLKLQQVASWDTLGMRGTCSETHRLVADTAPEQLLPVPYAVMSAETMLPTSHITWAALWTGITTGAVARARAFLRDRARKAPPGATPPGAPRLAETLAQLQLMRANVAEAVHRYEAAMRETDALSSISFALAMNALKTGTSSMAVQVIGQAMLVAGLSGYRNNTPYSLGRHLRDAHSAALMISNDRILGNSAALLTAYRSDERLFA